MTRGFLIVLLLASVVRAQPLRVGTSAVNLEADDSMVIAGGIGPAYSKGQEGELRCVGVVVASEYQKLAIVACDVLFVARGFVDRAAAEIEKRCGIPPSHLLVNATHTHHAPSTTSIHGYAPNELFVRRLESAIVQSVEKACANLSDATFSYALGEEKTVGQNSRLLLSDNTIYWVGSMDDAVRPTDPFDPQLPVLAFRSVDQKLKAVLFNHSTHTIGTLKSAVRSPAFYGLAAQQLEAELGCTVSFLQGASGSTHRLGTPTPAESIIRIKNAVTGALSVAQPQKVTALKSIKRPFHFKVRTFDEQIEDDKVVSYCRKRMPGGADTTIKVFREMRKELAAQQGQQRTTWLQACAIGDVAVVAVPAEYFTVLGLEIKKRSPFKNTFIAELANDWIGYLPDRKGHELGGYQTWTGLHSYAEPGTGERIAEEAIEILKELHE